MAERHEGPAGGGAGGVDPTATTLCPACQKPVEQDLRRCPICQTVYHRSCLPPNGCYVLGCKGVPTATAVGFAREGPWWPWAERLGLVLFAVIVGWIIRPAGQHLVSDLALFVALAVAMLVAGGATYFAARDDRQNRVPPRGGSRPDGHGTDGFEALGLALLSLPVGYGLGMVLPMGFGALTIAVAFVVSGLATLTAIGHAMAGALHDKESSRAVCLLAIVGTVTGSLTYISITGFRRERAKANLRACYANQKTVAGAIEMYELDKSTRRTVLDAALWTALKSGGYLSSTPCDPGFGLGSSAHYRRTGGGTGMVCTEHGALTGPAR
ncbi:MAG: hypothetical protein HY815_14225 [Candidatus Riflebacteria bacterium]|nr:hypothetical protein [Candidatus Riflebacteria bacterium]